MSNKPFKLSATLTGHTQDVKSVTFFESNIIFSCARDTTARVWKKNDNSKSDNDEHVPKWIEDRLYQNSNPGFLNATAAISLNGKDYLVSSGQDALIQLWPLQPESDQPYEPEFILAAHGSNVCCLNVCQSGPEDEPTIISGSWDCSAIVWRKNVVVHTLKAHSAAVWAVLGLGDPLDSTLTGGADNLIILWKLGKQVLTFKGHTQAVRALVKLPQAPNSFASAGNDATIRIWNLNGQTIRVLDGHDSFIYSMSSLPTGEIVSSGEDRTVRIWDPVSGQLTQTVTIPAISVWTVSTCAETGDLVCGSSDNLIRIFTRVDERIATSSELSQFDESVAASSVPSATVGDIKKSDLPTVAVLLSRRGKKEGEVAMAKDANGVIEAFQWDGMKGDWTKVGAVVDAIGSARKQLFEGKEYDYVFEVDIQDGVPPLKLPYNASENPYIVAQKWLANHKLPESYVDQIVQFIDKNSSGVALGESAPGADPFTGAGSYRPGSVPNAKPSSIGADPLTSSGSYRPGGGANSSAGAQVRRTKCSTAALLPHISFLTFPPNNSNIAPVIGKIKEFNAELARSGFAHQLDATEIEAIESFTSCLSKPDGTPSELGVKVLKKMMLNWPIAMQFPAIDIVRMASISFLPQQILPTLLAKIQEFNGERSSELNVMLSLRALSNSLSSSPVKTEVNKRELMRKIYDILTLDRLSNLKMTTKNAKVALATLLLNLSILSLEGTFDENELHHLVSLTSWVITAESEEETIYRSLIGMGNLAFTLKNLDLLTEQQKSSISTVLSSIKVGAVRPHRLVDARKEIHLVIK